MGGAMNDLSSAPAPEDERPRKQRKPDWIRVKAPVSKGYQETRKLMRDLKLNTVCEEAVLNSLPYNTDYRHEVKKNKSFNHKAVLCNQPAIA